MPSILDYDELNLTGMDIAPVSLRVERLTARFGSGYRAAAAVGPASGLWGWEIGSECLPDDADYQNLIESKPRFQYYEEFYRDHTVGDASDIFVIDFRGKKYHAAFADNEISGEMQSYDVFSLSGVKLEMARVPGIYYLDDGSIFDPRDLDYLWGWWRAENYDDGVDWGDISGSAHDLSPAGDVLGIADVQNGRPVVRLNSVANTGKLSNSTVGVRVYAALIVMKMREATFSNNAGVLTGLGGSTTKILAGTSGTTKFADQSFGSFSYKLDGTSHAQADEQAPMNTFGIVSILSTTGIDLDGLQFGKSRTTAGTFAEADIGEIIVIGTPLATGAVIPNAADISNLIAFLRRGWATP